MKKIVIIIAALVVIVGAAAYLNRGSLTAKKQSQDNAVFALKAGAGDSISIDMNTVTSLGGVDFKANIKKSGKDPVEHSFTGVPLKKVLEKYNITLTESNKVSAAAVDGYTSALSVKEILEDDNVYLTYSIDGKSLGKKEDGGMGPYMIVIRKDPFSQRWCKFLSEVNIQ